MSTIIRNTAAQILAIILLALLVLSGYFIGTAYYNSIAKAEQYELERLHGIATTLAVQMDGDQLSALLQRYPQKDGILSNTDDAYYAQMQAIFAKVTSLNKLESPVYTLTLDQSGNGFFFGITSAENPYFRHPYSSFQPQLKTHYQEGGLIEAFEDDHGTWLAAFAPVLASDQSVVAIVEVDQPFDSFIAQARENLLLNVALALALVVVVGGIMLLQVRKILAEENRSKKELERQHRIIEEKNRDITDSIRYAEKIQQAIIPDRKVMLDSFAEGLVLFLPRDIVSGDFYWFHKANNSVIIAVADCTGHGVPGAMMSMIGHSLLNEIVAEKGIFSPPAILTELNRKLIAALNQGDANDGMDIALMKIDLNTNTVCFAGAFRPLFLIRKGELSVLKGDAHPIGGGHFEADRTYSHHEQQLEKGDLLYCFSDGYADQFGGIKNKKFLTKTLRELLLETHEKPLAKVEEILTKRFMEWKGSNEQVDDVTLIGVRI